MEENFSILGLEDENTFELIRENRSRLDSNKLFRRYQQYYQGVLVEGGGVTAAYIIPDGGGTEPQGPCSKSAYFVSPQIFSNIKIDVNNHISDFQVTQIFDGMNIQKRELVIQPNFYQNCEYTLFWKVSYFDQGLLTKMETSLDKKREP